MGACLAGEGPGWTGARPFDLAVGRETLQRKVLVNAAPAVDSGAPEPGAGPVLLFDGECGLCHRVVRAMLRLDRRARLRFAPLQGPAAQAYLRTHGLPPADFDSLIFVPDWSRRGRPEFLRRTAGVVAALRVIGGAGGGLAAVLAVIPARWRDAAYAVVSRWRYRVFGPWRARPLPRAGWAGRFLT
jgi:predicted DCC family thiol-disulfide oxidoreductase YuxK